MPFGDHSTDRYAGPPRGGRPRASARDASIDEILKSIQQIIEEDPLTARPGNDEASETVRRLRSSEKPVRERSFDDAVPASARKRPARILKPAADDDVLAELLAPVPTAGGGRALVDQVSQASETAAPLISTEPVVTVVAAEATAPEDHTLAVEPEAASTAPLVHIEAEQESPPVIAAIAIEDAPVTVEPAVEVAVAIVADKAPLTVVSVDPVEEVAVEAAAPQPDPSLTTTADALLQSLAAGLGALGLVDDGTASAIFSVTVPDAAAETQPEMAANVARLTPQQAAAAAVAEVAAANVAAPPAMIEAEISSALVPPGAEPKPSAVMEVGSVPTEAAAAPVTVVEVENENAATASEQAAELAALPQAVTDGMEASIATMLRPMVRNWLDDHLPRMVEKALKEELHERPMPGSDNAST